MFKIELELDSEIYYAGDEISLDITLIKELESKNIQLLDGSVQLIGRSMFVSNFYSFPRVQEFFGEMSKVKEECKIISTDKGETFTFPFYVTKPSLLTLRESLECTWIGKLPNNVSASFIGLFCSFQHLARVKIIWKCVETGQIGVTQSEIIFKVLSNPKYSNSSIILGVLQDLKVPEKDLDEIFPDDDLIIEEDINKLLEEINYLKTTRSLDDDYIDVDEIVRSIVESDCGYNRSISAEINGSSLNIGTIYLRKTFIHPGTQIFITIDINLISRIEVIKLKLECIEIYPMEFVISDQREWRDTVKEMKISPGCQDRLEIIFPVSPELISSVSCPLFDLKWELLVNFKVGENYFDLKIPLNFISFKFEMNKKH